MAQVEAEEDTELELEVEDSCCSVSVTGDDARAVILDDGSRYDLEQLDIDPLLNNLKDWDYPIFDLLDLYDQHILSAVSST